MSTSEGEQTTQACATGTPAVPPLPPKMRSVSSGLASVRAAGRLALHRTRAQGKPTGPRPVADVHLFMNSFIRLVQTSSLSLFLNLTIGALGVSKRRRGIIVWLDLHRCSCAPCLFGGSLRDRYRRRSMYLGCDFFASLPSRAPMSSPPRAADSDPSSGWRRFTQARVRPVCDDIRRFFGWAGDRRSRTLPNTSRT
jgi:hypothetical protein